MVGLILRRVTMGFEISTSEIKPQNRISVRLFLLTIIFIMLAEIMIFIPSVSNFRNHWLTDKTQEASIIAISLTANPNMTVQERGKLLAAAQSVELIAFQYRGRRQSIARSSEMGEVGSQISLADASALTHMISSIATLFSGGERYLRVISVQEDYTIDIIVNEQDLHKAMLSFAWRILGLSLMISGFTGGLIFLALQHMLVRPIQLLNKSIQAFAENPQGAQALSGNSSRQHDEIDQAQQNILAMQRTIQQNLAQNQRLATVGLAVSKINHELRNLLGSAQLLSDALTHIQDENVQRIAPRLLGALNRAVDFCQATMSFGAAKEPAPIKQLMRLHPLVEDVGNAMALEAPGGFLWDNQVREDFEIWADYEQMYRVLSNLARNAIAAMKASKLSQGAAVQKITIHAQKKGAWHQIRVADTGPGVPEILVDKLFAPFANMSGRSGTGLGLTIAREIIQAHNGELAYQGRGFGAVFVINIPSDSSDGG